MYNSSFLNPFILLKIKLLNELGKPSALSANNSGPHYRGNSKRFKHNRRKTLKRSHCRKLKDKWRC